MTDDATKDPSKDQVTINNNSTDRGSTDYRDYGSSDHKSKKDAKGITVGAVGGVEGYSGSLAPRINAGPSWGVNVDLQPTRVLGLELGYSGATNKITDPAATGARIIRNGANANLKVSLAPTRVEPYVFGGIGVSRADIRSGGKDASAGAYRDDTFGMVPVGAGLNLRAGKFTAGLRTSYNFLFNKDFTPATPANSLGVNRKTSGDSFNGVLSLGSTFF